MRGRRPAARKGRKVFAKRVMAVVNRKAETKCVMITVADDAVLKHNTATMLQSNALECTIGTRGELSIGNNAGTRIGDSMYCKGIKCRIMIESQQYRPKATYWLYLVRNKVNGDQPAVDLFEGGAPNMAMEWIDTNKVDIKFCKKFTLTMPNIGTTEPMGHTVDGLADITSEGVESEETYSGVTNPQVITKFYVPFNKRIQYRDHDDASASYPVQGMRYQWVMVTYNNATTTVGGSTYPVGHVTMTTKMLFTDVI